MEEEIVQDGVTYIREDLMEAVIRQYRIERDEALEHTCSKNERAFLDEIREKFEISEDYPGDPDYAIHNVPGSSQLWQSDFTECNLSELVEGKG